jgi:hypothetical protein
MRRDSCYEPVVRTLLILVLAMGCHDASKDLEDLANRCTKCGSADKACAEKVVDDLVTYVKAHPDPVGNEQNASDQLKALTTCAQAHGVDGNELISKTKSL